MMSLANTAILRIVTWMKATGLELAPEKNQEHSANNETIFLGEEIKYLVVGCTQSPLLCHISNM